jgi:O-antigen/teichoic acid export membrane protein
MKSGGTKSASNLVNALLYSSESITALLFSVISISLIARHFGPDILARYSVVQSVSTIFIVFATLGLDQFIIRELARNNLDTEYVTSTVIGLFAGWLLYVILTVAYYLTFKNFSNDLFLIVNVVVSTLFLKVIFIKSYLQAENNPKPIAIASLVSRLLSITYLLVGSHLNFSLDAMMFYLPLQAFALILVMSISQPDFFELIKLRHFNLKRLVSTMREASPVFFSTVLYFFYNQSDILIMSNMLDSHTVGIYSAPIRLIPQAAFIGFVLVATFYREMDKKLLADRNAFEAYVKLILTIQFGVGIVLATVVFLTSDLLIHLLYGARYADSGRVLAIACWAWVFILPAALYSRLLIMLGYARYELIKMLIVAPLIVILNYLVISRIGMIGCAVVFVFSYFLVDFLIYFLFKDTRHLGKMGLEALVDIFTKPRQTLQMSITLLKTRH